MVAACALSAARSGVLGAFTPPSDDPASAQDVGEERYRWASWAGIVMWWGLAVAAVVGGAVLRRRTAPTTWPLWLLLCPVASVTITTVASTVPGTYNATVRASADGAADAVLPFTLVITAAPNISVSIGSVSASVAQGTSSSTLPVTINRTNFADAVTLSIGGTVPAGAAASGTGGSGSEILPPEAISAASGSGATSG
jgi:hypothetical protein